MLGKSAHDLSAAEVRDIAVRYLARREYGIEELKRKLVQRGAESDLVEQVVSDCAEQGLVSDERFTEMYVRMRIRRCFGPMKIRGELRQRGIPERLVAKELQVDQEIRLNRIRDLEQQSLAQQANEEWESAIGTFQAILEIDDSLEFAQTGLQQAQQMTALHEQLDTYIAKPDSLSSSSTMQRATMMVVDITRMPNVGPRLSGQRDELSRLLKRAATPLQVQLVSDNATDVSIYKVGKLGSFATHELSLRPGKYVAVGSRAGFRDVRLEFQIGPELEAKPIVIRCEEAI